MTWTRLPLTLFKLGWLLAFSIGLVVTVMAQTDDVKINIISVDSSTYPLVIVQATARDAQGLALTNLDATHFEVSELGQAMSSELISVDNNPTTGMATLLALDTSMGDTELAQMKSAAKTLINQLGTNDVAALLVFDEQVITKPIHFTANKADLLQSVEELKAAPSARTAFYEAAIEASKATAAVSLNQKQRAVIMMTNIGDNVNKTSLETALQETQATRIPIYIIGFSNRSATNRPALDKLAQATGGQAMVINEATDLTTMLQWLVVVLRQSYHITFRAKASLETIDPRFTLKITTPAGSKGEAQGAFKPTASSVKITVLGLSPDQVVLNNLTLSSQIQSPAPVLSVTYQLDEQPPVEVTNAPYSFLLDTSRLSPGQHILTVNAIDQIGNMAETVRVPFRLPQAVGVAPSLRVQLGEPVILQALTNTTALPNEIEFLFDGTLLGQANDQYQYQFDKQNPHYPQQPGIHTITIQMKDALEQSGQGNIVIEFMSTTGTIAIPSWRALVCLVSNFVLLLLLSIVAFFLRRPKSASFETLPTLTLVNNGNARSQYELTAKVIGGLNALTFQFTQVSMTQTPAVAVSSMPVMAATPALSQPATGNMPRDRQSTQAIKTTAADGMNKAKQGLGCINQVVEVVIGLLELIAIIPGVGRPFLLMATNLRKQQTQARQMIEAPGQVVAQFQNQAQQVQSRAGMGGQAGLKFPGATGGAVSDDAASEGTAMLSNGSTSTYSSTGTGTTVGPAKVINLPMNWQEAPFRTTCVEPHDNITLKVRVAAVKPPRRSVTCVIELQSQTLGDESGLLTDAPNMEKVQHEIVFGGTSPFRLILGVANWLALFLLIAVNSVVLYYYWDIFWTTFKLPAALSFLL